MPENLYLIVSFTVSFLVVFYAIPRISLISIKKKLYAIPNERTASQKIIPNLGGVGIFAGIFIGTVCSLKGMNADKIIELLLCALVMFFIGLQDDTIGLSAKKKLIAQIAVAVYLITICNIRFTNLHGILGLYEINYLSSFLITLISIVGLVNAFNLIDGIDGLAAGLGTLISATFGFLFLYFGEIEFTLLSFSITGGLISFFFYNVFGTKNKIFMGDTGSLTLGVLFAGLTISLNEITPTQHVFNKDWASPAITMAIMIIPVIDSIRVMFIRISQGRSPFSADMSHIHHQLIKITNKNHLQATIIMVVANLFFIVFSFGVIEQLGTNLLFFTLLLAGFTLAYVPFLINKKRETEEESKNVMDNAEEQYFQIIHSIKKPPVVKKEVEEEELVS